jgi:hypothetical protein
MNQRIVINRCYGGFGLSDLATQRYRELAWIPEEELFWTYDIPRDGAILLQVIDELGAQESSGPHAELKVIEVPEGVKWHIGEYDGMEWIAEDHRQWGLPDYELDDGQLTDEQYDRIREEVQKELFPTKKEAIEDGAYRGSGNEFIGVKETVITYDDVFEEIVVVILIVL